MASLQLLQRCPRIVGNEATTLEGTNRQGCTKHAPMHTFYGAFSPADPADSTAERAV